MARSHIFPDTPSLRRALSEALAQNGEPGEVAIARRSRNPYTSTFPSEIVRCTVGGRPLAILAKYEIDTEEEAYNHRRSLGYEADAYQHILSRCPLSRPRYCGRFEAPDRRTWLFLEFVDCAFRIDRTPDPAAMGAAARWLGEFHSWSSQWLNSTPVGWLQPYDADFYAGWPERAVRFDEQRHRWLPGVCERASQALGELVVREPVLIHGECYPHNVLWRDGAVYPVDWQSAGMGAGEVDLAALLERWDEGTVRTATEQYGSARWPGGAPHDFEHRFATAGIYWSLRWLGGKSQGSGTPALNARLRTLRQQAKRAGWI